jgi:ribosome biogenesis GTPase A
VGYPNVGKSSVINTLRTKKVGNLGERSWRASRLVAGCQLCMEVV